MAYNASHNSDDLDTQVGAVLLADGRVVVGCNSFPNGVHKTQDRIRRPAKYAYMVHAEEAAILRAAALGRSTSGGMLICPYASCAECAKAIISAGVTNIIRHKQCMDRMPERWKESCSKADVMLNEAGVGVMDFDAEIGGTTQLFDGEIWKP